MTRFCVRFQWRLRCFLLAQPRFIEVLSIVFLPLPPAAAYDECSPVTVETGKVQSEHVPDDVIKAGKPFFFNTVVSDES